ncbi:GNAT family N-acetyltransferase [Urechidicola sp. KH5]
MQTLKGKHIILRALEPSDLDFLFEIENNQDFWEISHTITPYSKHLLKQYINNAHLDIYEAKQLRLTICLQNNTPVGFIDIFDFNPMHLRAGLGILINAEFQGNGYAKEAVRLARDYCFTNLKLHQLYVNISSKNNKSIQLFNSLGFEIIGAKKQWNLTQNGFVDELMLQQINE